MKLKSFRKAKIVKNRSIAACFTFDCEDEVGNFIQASEIDLGDTKDSIEGL